MAVSKYFGNINWLQFSVSLFWHYTFSIAYRIVFMSRPGWVDKFSTS